MVINNIRQNLASISDKFILFSNPSFDNSILGYSSDNRVIYDYHLMLDELSADKKLSKEEASKYLDDEIIKHLSQIPMHAPIIMRYL